MPTTGKPQFNALTIKYNGLTKSIVTEVGLTPAFDPFQYQGKKPPFNIINKHTLWDTGATNSVLTPETVSEMKLTPVGITDVIHYGGTKQINTYLVNFFFPENVMIYGVLVSESENIIGDFGAIIGMDIITKGDFSITNVNNLTWMSYRIPSIQTIDYVVEANRIKYAGIDKYGPCPCGKRDEKGRPVKFKFCHGKDL